MCQLSNPKKVEKLLSRHGFSFQKSLGQNFLVNPDVCPRMAEESGVKKGGCALEIGPGIGVLTVELAKRANHVLAIEIDERLSPILKETLSHSSNVSILWGDVLSLDLQALISEHFSGKEVTVCANLPYYITTPILTRLLEERLPISSITVMVQKETGERLIAKPGERACGAISSLIWYYSTPRPLFLVEKESFLPPPSVDSLVIRLDVRKDPPVDADPKVLFSLIRGGFSMRRKTLSNCLASAFSFSKELVEKALKKVGLSPNVRAEALTLEDFSALTHLLFEKTS